ncbi:MAG: NADH-quinone oxidoreductase subunit C [Actinomycetota bacterium]|nr:NADH-quinone oxidoreductase subunit C [Actinomycetota bacterium]
MHSSLKSGEIEDLAYLVLMEAAKGADQDLKFIMSEIQAVNAAKAKLRELIAEINRDVTSNADLPGPVLPTVTPGANWHEDKLIASFLLQTRMRAAIYRAA